MRTEIFAPVVLKYIPRTLEPHTFYISEVYGTTAHLCACGCRTKVFLPLSPAEWRVKFDEVGITVRPSVGNWEFPCRSHYFITQNAVQWAAAWDQVRVEDGRRKDGHDLDKYFDARKRRKFWRRLRGRLLGR
ncbi:DUF6527 family protein [Agromyces sp. LHK192]|uniref:DUF6527 family protein n=1 Tax=Agromyces sp. LHK192 TaxID=2498704 RepID=UPI000FDC41C5|nr:DUF6527 family protein [Agromyces sp. LHK192]